MRRKFFSYSFIRPAGIFMGILLSLLAYSCGGKSATENPSGANTGGVTLKAEWVLPESSSSTGSVSGKAATTKAEGVDVCSSFSIDKIKLEIWQDTDAGPAKYGYYWEYDCTDNRAILAGIPSGVQNLFVRLRTDDSAWGGDSQRFYLDPGQTKDLGQILVSILSTVVQPAYSAKSGTYSGSQSVELSSTTPDASIRYTTDGSTPNSTTGTLYSGPITVSSTTTIKAVSYLSDGSTSEVSTATYTITETAGAPTFSPSPAIYATAQNVTLSSTTAGATIRYTTDGTTPTETTGTVYSGPFTVSATTTIKAVAYQTGLVTSAVSSGTYTITGSVNAPVLSPSPSSYAADQNVTLSTSTAGATIRYTTDGTTPTETTGTVYSGPFTVSSSMTIKAVAYLTGWTTSSVSSGTYTLNIAKPVFSPFPGTYVWSTFGTTAQNVTLSTSTTGATIRYTTDGSTPTETNGTVYSGAIPVSWSTKLKAFAYKTGWTASPTTSGVYTVTMLAVSGGSYHTIGLTKDGTVWAWGRNTEYQVGGTNAAQYSPMQITTLDNVLAVSAGSFHNVAVKKDGTAWGWGQNMYGQLGNNSTTTPLVPVQASTITNAVGAAAGGSFTLVLLGDGTVRSYGGNSYGQLGDTTTTGRTTPVQVSGLSNVVAVSAGYMHGVALKNDGTVWTWGYNGLGQLGDGSGTTRLAPVQVPDLTDVIAVSAGYYHTLALKDDGTVWAWGYNYFGQLGDGSISNRFSPVQVSGLTGIRSITTKFYHNIAAGGGETIWVWGNNDNYQLGDGTNTTRYTPVSLTAPANVYSTGKDHSHKAATLGLYGWGSNSSGQIGDGTITYRLTPSNLGSVSCSMCH